MKKGIIFWLVLIAIIFILSGCNKSNNINKEKEEKASFSYKLDGAWKSEDIIAGLAYKGQEVHNYVYINGNTFVAFPYGFTTVKTETMEILTDNYIHYGDIVIRYDFIDENTLILNDRLYIRMNKELKLEDFRTDNILNY